jgi:hypothetical protein
LKASVTFKNIDQFGGGEAVPFHLAEFRGQPEDCLFCGEVAAIGCRKAGLTAPKPNRF